MNIFKEIGLLFYFLIFEKKIFKSKKTVRHDCLYFSYVLDKQNINQVYLWNYK